MYILIRGLQLTLGKPGRLSNAYRSFGPVPLPGIALFPLSNPIQAEIDVIVAAAAGGIEDGADGSHHGRGSVVQATDLAVGTSHQVECWKECAQWSCSGGHLMT